MKTRAEKFLVYYSPIHNEIVILGDNELNYPESLKEIFKKYNPFATWPFILKREGFVRIGVL